MHKWSVTIHCSSSILRGHMIGFMLLTILPRLAELQGSIANSRAVLDMASPVFCTSSTAWIISGSMSGFSKAICCPLSTKLAVALSTAATSTWALLDFPFFFWGDLEETNVVTYKVTQIRFSFQIGNKAFLVPGELEALVSFPHFWSWCPIA